MNITDDNKAVLLFFGAMFFVFGTIAGYDCINSIIQTTKMQMFVFMCSIFCFIIGILLFNASTFTRKFDEEGIHMLKKGIIYHTTRWDDYHTAYFKFEAKKRIITIYLSPIDIELSDRKKGLTKKFIEDNGVYPIIFNCVLEGSDDFDQIIEFVEKKYKVSYKNDMSRGY